MRDSTSKKCRAVSSMKPHHSWRGHPTMSAATRVFGAVPHSPRIAATVCRRIELVGHCATVLGDVEGKPPSGLTPDPLEVTLQTVRGNRPVHRGCLRSAGNFAETFRVVGVRLGRWFVVDVQPQKVDWLSDGFHVAVAYLGSLHTRVGRKVPVRVGPP